MALYKNILVNGEIHILLTFLSDFMVFRRVVDISAQGGLK